MQFFQTFFIAHVWSFSSRRWQFLPGDGVLGLEPDDRGGGCRGRGRRLASPSCGAAGDDKGGDLFAETSGVPVVVTGGTVAEASPFWTRADAIISPTHSVLTAENVARERPLITNLLSREGDA